MYRRAFYFCAASFLLVAAPAKSSRDLLKGFRTQLHQACVNQQLDSLSSTDLNAYVTSYEIKLDPAQDQNYKQSVKHACQNSKASDCVVIGFIRAARKGNFDQKFINSLCQSGVYCTGPSHCAVPNS